MEHKDDKLSKPPDAMVPTTTDHAEQNLVVTSVDTVRDDIASRLQFRNNTLEKAIRCPEALADEEIKFLLSDNILDRSFEEIAELKKELVGEHVFVRASIEVSNFCRLACHYCGMSRDNKSLERFRMEKAQILRQIEIARELGVDIIHLTSAEDPKFPIKDLCEIVSFAKSKGLETVLVLGDKKRSEYEALYEAGARKFTMKFETSDPELLRSIKAGYSPKRRLGLIDQLREIGFQIGTGVIVGLPGQNLDILVSDLRLLRSLKPEMASASVFIPNEESEFGKMPNGNEDLTMRFNILMRLLLRDPTPTIPASTSFDTEGQIRVLKASANVVSIHLTPEDLVHSYSMYGGQARTISSVERVKSLIASAGLKCNLK